MALKLNFTNNTNGDVIETPDSLLNQIKMEFGDDLFDPCPVNPQWDGLAINWQKKNFVNPPYSDLRGWVAKSLKEYQERGNETLLLIPLRATNYYRDLVFPNISEMYFFTELIKFKGFKRPIQLNIVLLLVGTFKDRDYGIQRVKEVLDHPYRVFKMF